MSERYMTLLGAEEVRSAANTMRGAAETMSHAASNMGNALERHQRFMDEWMTRFESAIERLVNHDGALADRPGGEN